MTELGLLRDVHAADGVRLQYEILGAGEPVVFLHGGFMGRDAFRRQRPLAQYFRLVLRDLRGHNGSEPRVPPDYTVEGTEVGDLECVLDAEGIPRTDLVAHSAGGAFAFAFALRRPDRVRRMILIEPAIFSLLPPDLRAQHRAECLDLMALAERSGPVAGARGLVATIAGPGWEKSAHPNVIAQVEAATPIFVPHIQAMLAFSVTLDDVRALRPPVLYLYGEKSLPYFRAIMSRIIEACPAARRCEVADAGHVLPVQRAAEVNAAIREFLLGQ